MPVLALELIRTALATVDENMPIAFRGFWISTKFSKTFNLSLAAKLEGESILLSMGVF